MDRIVHKYKKALVYESASDVNIERFQLISQIKAARANMSLTKVIDFECECSLKTLDLKLVNYYKFGGRPGQNYRENAVQNSL